MIKFIFLPGAAISDANVIAGDVLSLVVAPDKVNVILAIPVGGIPQEVNVAAFIVSGVV
jgi:hypothetical protein